MSILDKFLRITQKDGSVWQVPVRVIAENRARYYKSEFDGYEYRSMEEDTLPLFEGDDYEIEDWAANNMNWDEVSEHAVQLSAPKLTADDFQEAWVNGEKSVGP